MFMSRIVSNSKSSILLGAGASALGLYAESSVLVVSGLMLSMKVRSTELKSGTGGGVDVNSEARTAAIKWLTLKMEQETISVDEAERPEAAPDVEGTPEPLLSKCPDGGRAVRKIVHRSNGKHEKESVRPDTISLLEVLRKVAEVKNRWSRCLRSREAHVEAVAEAETLHTLLKRADALVAQIKAEAGAEGTSEAELDNAAPVELSPEALKAFNKWLEDEVDFTDTPDSTPDTSASNDKLIKLHVSPSIARRRAGSVSGAPSQLTFGRVVLAPEMYKKGGEDSPRGIQDLVLTR